MGIQLKTHSASYRPFGEDREALPDSRGDRRGTDSIDRQRDARRMWKPRLLRFYQVKTQAEGRKKDMNRPQGNGLLAISIFSFSHFHFWGGAGEVGGEQGGEGHLKTDKGFGFTASRAPIYIESDRLEARSENEYSYLSGERGGQQEDVTLYAKHARHHYDPESKKLKEMLATVCESRPAGIAGHGPKGYFDQDKNKGGLGRDAVVREGTNVIRGERITFYVEEERKAFVEPGKGGVSARASLRRPKEEGRRKNQGRKKK